jgi:PAS domain S-box-containing protein
VIVGGVGLSDGMGVACVIDISRRKQAEEAIRATNEKVLEILESIGESFISLDREWRFKYINQRAATLLGMDPESLLGQTLWEKVPPLVGSPFEGHYRKAMSEQVASVFESRIIDGRWIEVRLHPSAEGLTIYVNDITGRKRAEKAVRESEERLRFAVESARLMILDWMAVPGGEKVVEESSTNLGAPLGGGLDVVHPEDRDRVAEARRRAAEGSGEYEAEFRLLREDGADMWVRGRGRVTRDRSGAAARVTDVFTDITEQKRLEAKVREQEARIAELTAASGALRGERSAEKKRGEAVLALNEVLRSAMDGARGADGALGADGEALEVKLPHRGARIIADQEELQRTLRDLLTSARRLSGGGGQITVDVEADEARGVATLTIRSASSAAGPGRGAELTIRLPLDRGADQQPERSLDS